MTQNGHKSQNELHPVRRRAAVATPPLQLPRRIAHELRQLVDAQSRQPFLQQPDYCLRIPQGHWGLLLHQVANYVADTLKLQKKPVGDVKAGVAFGLKRENVNETATDLAHSLRIEGIRGQAHVDATCEVSSGVAEPLDDLRVQGAAPSGTLEAGLNPREPLVNFDKCPSLDVLMNGQGSRSPPMLSPTRRLLATWPRQTLAD
jgi:hypothetical protein